MKPALIGIAILLQTLYISIRVEQNTTFSLLGTVSEVSGTTDESVVTPQRNLGPAGTLQVKGTGAVVYSDDGVKFLQAGQQNTNTAYYVFNGASLSNVFNCDKGDISFSLTSAYNFADRLALTPLQNRYIFDVIDGNRQMFSFLTMISLGDTLKFGWRVCGPAQDVPVSHGSEDIVFGAGVTRNFRITWDSTGGHGTNESIAAFYMDGVQQMQFYYDYIAPSWVSSSSFVIGAQSNTSAEGYFSADEPMKNLVIRSLH